MEIKKESYKQVEQKAKDIYGTIKHIWCPPLNADIFFTREGFDHLIGKRGILRPKSERKRRLICYHWPKRYLPTPMHGSLMRKNR